MVRVLIVDDSASVRMLLSEILAADPGIEVIGTANDGEEALATVERVKPDVITMDIFMPRLNGLDATRRIMETRPVPIVIVSANLDAEEVASTFRAMEAGAVAALARPHGPGHPEHEEEAASFVRTVKLMAEVKVVRRWRRHATEALPPTPRARRAGVPGQAKIVAIGASTGGPMVLQTILAGLPPDFPLPLLIVQHMAAGFINGFAEWLSLTSGVPVRIASNGERLLPGHAYVAPDGYHMLVEEGDTVVLSASAPESGLRPSVSALFRSVARVYGDRAVGVLLTGMGSDGAGELRLMKDAGAVTIVQDRESSVIHGMPGEALKLKAATHTLPPEMITATLRTLAMER
jgi:two-component system chemotaxis response regulator CheB